MSSATDLTNYAGPANVPDSFWQSDIYSVASSGADPYLLAAIAQHETQFGTLGAGREGYELGYGYPAPGQGNPVYQGLENQLFYAGLQANSFFQGSEVTEESLKAFQDNSWKPGDQNWYKGVWSIYQSYTKDPSLIADEPLAGSGVVPVANVEKTETKGGWAYYGAMIILALVGVFFFSKIFK